MKQTNQGFLCVIGAVFLWTISGILGQLLYARGVVDPTLVIVARFLVAGSILLGIAYGKNGQSCTKVTAIFRNKTSVKQLIFFSIFGIGMVQGAYFYAIYESNAATATFLQYLSPAIVMVYVAIHQRSKPQWKEIACTILAIIGVFLLATHGDFHSLVLSPMALFWGILSAFGLAIYTVYPKKLMQTYGTELILAWSMLIAGCISVVVLQPWETYKGINFTEVCLLAALILLGTILSFLLFSQGVQQIGATKASLISTLEPPMTAVLTFALLHVEFQPMDYLGFACIMTITFLTYRK